MPLLFFWSNLMGTRLQTVESLSPGKDLAAYMQSIRAIAVLSADEELSLAKKLYFDNDLDAARQMVLAHLRFVVHIAKTYSGYGLNIGDLIQEGNVGLMKAVKRFDPRVGVRLVSFAVHWIKAEMHEFILKNWRIVKVATTKAQRKLFFNLKSAKKTLKWLTPDEINAVASDLGVKAETVSEMEGRLFAKDMAFDYTSDDSDTEERSSQAPVSYLSDQSMNPEVLLEQEIHKKNNLLRLQDAMHSLDERSRNIIYARWLDEDNKATLHDLAKKHGVSAERIRQLEKNAMKKVKSAMSTSLS